MKIFDQLFGRHLVDIAQNFKTGRLGNRERITSNLHGSFQRMQLLHLYAGIEILFDSRYLLKIADSGKKSYRELQGILRPKVREIFEGFRKYSIEGFEDINACEVLMDGKLRVVTAECEIYEVDVAKRMPELKILRQEQIELARAAITSTKTSQSPRS